MRQQFELALCNYRLYVWLGIIGMLTALLIALLAASQVAGSGLQLATMFAVSGAGFYGVYRLLKEATIRLAQLTLDANGLTVHYLSTGATTRITFAEVLSYRDEWLRDGRELRFRLRSGKKVRLATNNFLASTGGYDELLQAVQQAIAQRNDANLLPITREKSFFEKPFATVLLVAGGAAVLFAAGDMIFGHKPFRGDFLVAVGSLISYASIWRAARARQSKEE